MVEAVIFDMDGLLIDSEPFWRESHRIVLSEMGYEVTEGDLHAATGKRTSDQVAIWRNRFGFEKSDIETITNEVVDNVIIAVQRHGLALPGVHKLIEELYAHDVLMAVASSSSMRLINVVLDL